MSSQATLTPPKEVSETRVPDKNMLVERFGSWMLEEGYNIIPRRISRRYRELGITPTEMQILEHIMEFWWFPEKLPCPSLKTIAEEIGKSIKQVRRYIRRLEAKGVLEVIPAFNTEHGGQTSNTYNLFPLLKAVWRLDHPENEEFTVSTESADQQTKMGGAPSHPREMTPSHSRESNKTNLEKDKLKNHPSNLSDLSSLNEEVLEPLSSNGSAHPKQNGNTSNSSYNSNNGNKASNDYKPNDTVEKIEIENSASQEQAAAPPAWSNVPREVVPPLPMYLESVLEDLSAQYHDLAPKSTKTRVAKMFQEVLPYGADEYHFAEIISYARNETSRANVTNRNKDGSVNRMGYFFDRLRANLDHNIRLWQEEDRIRAEEEAMKGGDASPQDP